MKNIEECQICKQYRLKSRLKRRKVGKTFFTMCPQCDEEIKLTTQCMAISTDSLVKRLPNKYRKVGTIAVSPIE